MNEQNNVDEIIEREYKKTRKTKIIIITVFAVSLVLMAIFAMAPDLLESGGAERETLPPVDPDKLHDTKEEDFDIMEYDEYLKYDRNIYLDDKHTGVKFSLDETTAGQYGAGLMHLYKLIGVITAGDSDTYNEMVAESVGHYQSFTQQQIYDVVITKHSQTDKEGKNGNYTEYVYLLEYKIHENNGTYRNTVEPDASRPQYIVINNSTGEYLVMDIIDIIYKN